MYNTECGFAKKALSPYVLEDKAKREWRKARKNFKKVLKALKSSAIEELPSYEGNWSWRCFNQLVFLMGLPQTVYINVSMNDSNPRSNPTEEESDDDNLMSLKSLLPHFKQLDSGQKLRLNSLFQKIIIEEISSTE